MAEGIDLESFRYSETDLDSKPKASKPIKRKRPAFLRGPIPIEWLSAAAKIPRRNAIVVGIVLWHLAGLRNEYNGLVLCVSRCKPFGLGRKSVERGLRDLESAGLVEVTRNAGNCARVDLVLSKLDQAWNEVQ